MILIWVLGAMFGLAKWEVRGCENFSPPVVGGRMVALRAGLLDWDCAGQPRETFPALADSRVSWFQR